MKTIQKENNEAQRMEGDRQKDAKGMQEEKNHYDWSSSSDTSQEDNVEAEKRRSFRCGSCSRSFIRFFELTKHKKKHHGVEISGSPEKTTSGLNHQDEGSPELRTQSEDFQCSICSKTFKKKNYLRMHGMLHGKKIFICTICEKTFSVYYLIRHLKSHSKRREKPHVCKICGKGFKHKSALNRHSKVLHEINHKNFECAHCGNLFLHKQSIKRHLNSKCPRREYSIHGKFFKNKTDMQNCPRDYSLTRNFQCDRCPKTYKHKESLRTHKLMIHEKKAFTCAECGKEFSRKQRLIKHMQMHKKKQFFELTKQKKKHHEVKIISSESSEKITSKTFGLDHQNDVSLLQKPHSKDFQCSHCSKTFKKKQSLRLHERLHGEKIFKCKICEKTFATKYYLVNHSKIHSERRDHECQECGKTFKTRNSLRQHHMIHSSEKPHVCKICGKGFKLNHILERHYKVHERSRSKNLECALCGGNFISKKSIRRHLSQHNAKGMKYFIHGKFFKNKTDMHRYLREFSTRSFQCDRCPKAYKHKVSLQRHQLTSHEKKTFLCGICGKKVTSKQNLNYHMQIHDKNRNIYECAVCERKFFTPESLRNHLLKKHLRESTS